MADVMERSLDVTAATITHTAPLATAPTTSSAAPPSIVTSPVELQTTQLSSIPPQPLANSSLASASPMEILDQVIRIISADDSFLSDDELLSASLFFTSGSEDAVRAARTFIALGSNQAVQHRFLLHQLEIAALLPGKGKGKAVEGDDHIMVY